MMSTGNFLITGGIFTQTIEASSRDFESLAQRVATRARHDSGELSDPAKCHPETRVAILTDLEEWAEGTTYNYPIKWITGSAGVGKTAIMRTLAEILERRKLLLADFFFWRTGERCNTANFFIATLAYQISISIPETRLYIEGAVKEDPHIFTRTLEAQSRALIVNPIVSVYGEKKDAMNYPRIFVVDGLDECLDDKKQSQDIEKQTEVFQVLHWTLSQLPAPFGLLIASRPEHHIQRTFDLHLKDSSSSIMLNDLYNADSDIKRFYLTKFQEIRQHHPLRSYLPSEEWPSTYIVDELTHRASGQFIYASTVTKFIATSKKNPSSQLNLILDARIRGNTRPFQPLDLLYSVIFTAIVPEDLLTTLRVLGVLLIGRSRGTRSNRLSPNSFPPSFWDTFLGLQYGEVERLMLGLESILKLRGPDGGFFRFYHASLQDFLFDPSRSGSFFIDKDMVYEDVAKQSLIHLYTLDDDMEAYIISGLQFWLKHANPSTALHLAIEQTGTPVHPRHLKLRFPVFLTAIMGSNLPEKIQLWKKKQDAYRSRLLPIISLFYLEDKPLAFLIFAAVGGGAPAVGMMDKIIDLGCPLPPDSVDIDLGSEGFCLYEDLTLQDFFLKDVESIFDYNMFIECVDNILTKIPETGDLCATAASLLVMSLTQLSSACPPVDADNEPDKVYTVTSNILKYLLRRASIQSGLREWIKNNSIPPKYLDHVKIDIDEYLLRDRLSQEVQRQRTHSLDFRDGQGTWTKGVADKELENHFRWLRLRR